MAHGVGAYVLEPTGILTWARTHMGANFSAVLVRKALYRSFCAQRRATFNRSRLSIAYGSGGRRWRQGERLASPAGQGAKGPLLYDWTRVRLRGLQSPPGDHGLLIRRSISDPKDGRSSSVSNRPKARPGSIIAKRAPRRAWRRHITLSMLAPAFSTVYAPACPRRGARPRSAKRTKGAWPQPQDRDGAFGRHQHAGMRASIGVGRSGGAVAKPKENAPAIEIAAPNRHS
jgi:hypothetical protein